MAPFAGWSMPIQYKDSIMDSALNCRERGGLFDVSYRRGLSFKGKDVIPFLEKIVVADVASMDLGTCVGTFFTNENGGVIYFSDLTKVNDEHIYVVVDSGCRDKDLSHIEEHMKVFKSKGGDVSWHIHDERSILFLEGCMFMSAYVLQQLTKDNLEHMYYQDFRVLDINGSTCYLTQTGYTGDGFEISVPSEHAVDLAKAILEKSKGRIRLAGLGALYCLRLEEGRCLYGNDLEEHITPVEAGMAAAVRRRRGRAKGGFLGAEVILDQIKAKTTTIMRVGIISTGPPSRRHCEILDRDGGNVGEIMSGGFSPFLKKNIAIGYVKSGMHKAWTRVKIVIRGKAYDGEVKKLPFVPCFVRVDPKRVKW